MQSLLYMRLIGFTAGTLLLLFWMVVILGYRRQRNFERVFFFLCLALFLFYSGSLLGLNAEIYYATPPVGLDSFAFILILAGLCFFPALLFHLHVEYASSRGLLGWANRAWPVVAAFYAPVIYFALRVYPLLTLGGRSGFLQPGNILGPGYAIWLVLALLAAMAWQFQFARKAGAKSERGFHRFLGAALATAAALAVWLLLMKGSASPLATGAGSTILALLAIPPLAVLIVMVQRCDFLQIGRQKNLVYAVTATFLGLLYLALVRRVGTWLEPVLPPEASAAILLFVLVIFFEPLQRVFGRRLEETAQKEMARARSLAEEVRREARQGDLDGLVRTVEDRAREAMELQRVRLAIREPAAGPEPGPRRSGPKEETYVVQLPGQLEAVLSVTPHGAMLSGESRAAVEWFSLQVAGAIELCMAIEEKISLERELAERERLAALGQMAASISHNLKNPLGSVKTILQVQLESPEMPESMRGETRMVLEEIGRLSAKLNQLLQFSRPAFGGEKSSGGCDLAEEAKAVAGVLRHQAARKGIALELNAEAEEARIGVSKEGAHDLVSNLVVNALEATASGGRVRIDVAREGADLVLRVEDDGAGIPAELHEKILQPFFTTKTQGTGLGLAIVARRVKEAGGKMAWTSPAQNGRGTRFEIRLPGVAKH